MDSESQDQVWELLKRVPAQRASGDFSQNVLRQVRLSNAEAVEPSPGGFWQWLLSPGLVGAAAITILVVAFGIFNRSNSSSMVEVTAPEAVEEQPILVAHPAATVQQQYVEAFAEEVEVMAFVDELLMVSDPSNLDDEALAELLF